MKLMQDLQLEVLPNSVLRDFDLLWPLNEAVCVLHFRSEEDVKEAVYEWLAQQPKDFLSH
jgi:hypothetical protein